MDDEQQVRESTKLLLAIDRHDVVEAAGGEEALELLRTQRFDLVILDYFMPGLQGSQVARRMKAMAPHLPILMITAFLEKLEDPDKPVDALIGKPFAIGELREAIAKLLS